MFGKCCFAFIACTGRDKCIKALGRGILKNGNTVPVIGRYITANIFCRNAPFGAYYLICGWINLLFNKCPGENSQNRFFVYDKRVGSGVLLVLGPEQKTFATDIVEYVEYFGQLAGKFVGLVTLRI